MIALQGLAHSRFLRMNTSMIDASRPADQIFFEDFAWALFTVVDADSGEIALHNTFHNRFVRMSSAGMDTSDFRAADELPADSMGERFAVVDIEGGSIALHSGVHNRVLAVRYCVDVLVCCSTTQNASELPSAFERFRVVQVKPFLEPGSVVALYCTRWSRFLRMNDQADMDSAPTAAAGGYGDYSSDQEAPGGYGPVGIGYGSGGYGQGGYGGFGQATLPDPGSWELFTVVDAGNGKIALHNAVHNRFASWLWGSFPVFGGLELISDPLQHRRWCMFQCD
ncbi:unnamed protein product [Symbiodinium sp. CCMP2592]|nr:unnamed protein product [Symbiodinium sp. CCMP2592]